MHPSWLEAVRSIEHTDTCLFAGTNWQLAAEDNNLKAYIKLQEQPAAVAAAATVKTTLAHKNLQQRQLSQALEPTWLDVVAWNTLRGLAWLPRKQHRTMIPPPELAARAWMLVEGFALTLQLR
jgi:hypothetical protein